ncbi:universal stress protein [Gilvimarinus sp. F26214L]|uniref:universal stress protein n=1 Tax=Gilvimarinus sp. DZF01 TaxID=3461371 RepID=UPI00404659FF
MNGERAMSGLFSSILLPLDGSESAVKPLQTALWLAEKTGARLHILSAGDESLPADEALQRLRVPAECRDAVILHQQSSFAEEAILEAIAALRVDLLVISACGAGTGGRPLGTAPREMGHVARYLLEQSTVPVLLAPPRFRTHLPMRSALVPVSGEPETDAVLCLAIRAAKLLDMRLCVAHVQRSANSQHGFEAEVMYPDSLYYEYAGRLEEMLSRAAQCSPEDFRSVVAGVRLCHGDIKQELFRMARESNADLLVTGWHGTLTDGHGALLRQLIRELEFPLLLTKPGPRPYFHLNVGEGFVAEE